MPTFTFEDALAPAKKASEADTIRAGVAGPMGATDADIDGEAQATRAQIAQTADPADKQMLEEHAASVEKNRMPKMPFSFEEASQPVKTFGFEEARQASQPLPASVMPSTAGAGRGSVNPPVAAPAGRESLEPLGDPMGTGAAEITTAAQPRDAGAGRGFVNPGDVQQRDVGFGESFARGFGRAGASTAKTLNLAAAAPVVVAEKLKNLITGSDSTSAQDATFRNLVDPTQSAVDWYSLKPDEKQGFLGKVGDALGAMAQDLPQMLAAGGATAPEALAQHVPTIARFIETAASKGFDAMRPIMIKAGTEKAQQVLDAGGTPEQAVNSAATAALVSGFQGMMPMSAQGPGWQRFLSGLPVGPAQSEGARVIQNAADPAAMHRDFDPAEAAAGAVTNAIASTAMGHRAPGKAPDRIDLGYDPITGKRPAAAAVDAAYPSDGSRHAGPGQAQPARDGASVKADIASQLDAIRPLQDHAKALREAGENVVADEMDRRANTQAADIELQAHPDATPEFADHYRTLRELGAMPAEASARAGMIGDFSQTAKQAGITPAAIQAAMEKATKMPLAKVPTFLDAYASELASAGMGTPMQPKAIETATKQAGEQAMGRAIDALYPKLREASIPEGAGTEKPATPAEGAQPAPGMQRFAPETGTLGIPREQMPQIASEQHGPLVNFLNARDIPHEIHMLDTGELKPTQATFDPEKVKAMAGVKNERAVLASSDGYILDGHHQWLAAKEAGESVKTIVLDAPIRELIEHAKEFPSARTAEESAREAPKAAAPDQAAGARGQEAGPIARANRAGADGGEDPAAVDRRKSEAEVIDLRKRISVLKAIEECLA